MRPTHSLSTIELDGPVCRWHAGSGPNLEARGRAESPMPRGKQIAQPAERDTRLAGFISAAGPCSKGKHMRVVSLLCGVVTLAAARGAAQDPVKEDPQHYKVEFENAQVRVLRIKYGPHEKSVMHWHPAGVAVLLTDLHVKFGLPGGKATEQSGTAGQVVSEAAGSHLPENLSDRPVELILLELKRSEEHTSELQSRGQL